MPDAKCQLVPSVRLLLLFLALLTLIALGFVDAMQIRWLLRAPSCQRGAGL